jgi:type III secretion protein C
MQFMSRGAFKLLMVAMIAVYGMADHALGAELPGAQQPLAYYVVDQDVAGVVTGIAAQLGVRAEVSNKVQGQVHGRLPAGSVRETLDRLGALYGFDWYFDGRTLFATGTQEAEARVMPLGAVPAGDLLQTLAAFGIADPRWPVRVSQFGDMAYVSGPPRFVGMTANVLSALAQRAHAGIAEVHVFRGATAGS